MIEEIILSYLRENGFPCYLSVPEKPSGNFCVLDKTGSGYEDGVFRTTLAAGLPEESRSRMHLAGQKLPTSAMLAASGVDALHRIEWRLIGQPGSSPPRSLLAALTGAETEERRDIESFDSPDAFDSARASVLKGGG